MWMEMRAAVAVARRGSVSAAADDIGVHRATITRHISTLEQHFGAKLFLRHGRGYTLTDLGAEVLKIADVTVEQLEQLRARSAGHTDALHGDLVITTVEVAVPTLMQAVVAFGEAYPSVTVHIRSSQSILKLEYGEAHVAFRLGPRPTDPDNVVKALTTMPMGLYASTTYVQRRGLPKTPDELSAHRFVTASAEHIRAPFFRWLNANVPDDCLTLFGNEVSLLNQAVREGVGIGFFPTHVGDSDPDLVSVMHPRPEWDVPVWLVTHVDLHRSAKVQAFLGQVRQVATRFEKPIGPHDTAVEDLLRPG